MVRNRYPQDGYSELRRRMIRETEHYLESAAAHPGGKARIPSVVVGKARFSEKYASQFWTAVLGVPYEPPPQKKPAIPDVLDPDSLRRWTPPDTDRFGGRFS